MFPTNVHTQINKREITLGALLGPVLKTSAKTNEIQENNQEQTHTFQGTNTSSTHIHSRIQDTHKTCCAASQRFRSPRATVGGGSLFSPERTPALMS